MRRTPGWRSDDETASLLPIDLTPMIDIVFLLLIFFMVSTRIMEPYGYQIELPETEAAPQQQGQTETPVLSVLADGGASINGERLARDAELTLPASTAEVVLRADRAASHGDVMFWMDRLQSAGIRQVTLASSPVENRPSP